MSEVVPAIIPASYSDLEEHISLVRKLVSRVQIDLIDGEYAPDASWPYNGEDEDKFSALIEQKIPFPFWEDVDFEIDMMVQEPEKYVDDWIKIGAAGIIVHIGSSTNIEEVIVRCKAHDVEVGLAVKPVVPTEEVEPYIRGIDFVQFMGSDNIGHHGESIDEAVYEKIREFKEEYPDVTISVDIGVTKKTAPELNILGVDRLVSGSTVFESNNIEQTLRDLENA